MVTAGGCRRRARRMWVAREQTKMSGRFLGSRRACWRAERARRALVTWDGGVNCGALSAWQTRDGHGACGGSVSCLSIGRGRAVAVDDWLSSRHVRRGCCGMWRCVDVEGDKGSSALFCGDGLVAQGGQGGSALVQNERGISGEHGLETRATPTVEHSTSLSPAPPLPARCSS